MQGTCCTLEIGKCGHMVIMERVLVVTVCAGHLLYIGNWEVWAHGDYGTCVSCDS